MVSTPPDKPPATDEGAFDLKRAASIKFLYQIVLTTAMLLFCGWQIATPRTPESEKAQYRLVAATLFAWWCPSPKP